MVLSREEARRFYDRFGSRQDSQGFYEGPALRQLVDHAGFEQASAVFELGCGTGRFAGELLGSRLSPTATYVGTDPSSTMVDLARRRLSPWGDRARVESGDDSGRFPLPGHSVDRVIATYVLDLMSEEDIRASVAESRRVLVDGGRLCLVSLTHGVSVGSRAVIALWTTVFRLNAALVGGCRPIELANYLPSTDWSVEHRGVVTPFGVPSEILVAAPR